MKLEMIVKKGELSGSIKRVIDSLCCFEKGRLEIKDKGETWLYSFKSPDSEDVLDEQISKSKTGKRFCRKHNF